MCYNTCTLQKMKDRKEEPNMNKYVCIASKYDNCDDVLNDLKPSPIDIHFSISKEIDANSLKEAFKDFLKDKLFDEFLSKEKNVNFYYLENGMCISYTESLED